MPQSLKTDFSKVQRGRERGTYDRDVVNAILDATPICHFGYVVEGRPVVTPTCHWRDGDYVYWHGSRISRALLKSENNQVSLTVTLLDGLVLARSAFHHSANYRSAMVFGVPELVTGDAAKTAALREFVDGLFPQRWEQLREMTRKELNATTVLRLKLDEGAAKVRTGPPNDDADDLTHPVWAGVIPLHTAVGEAEVASDMQMELPLPPHVDGYGR